MKRPIELGCLGCYCNTVARIDAGKPDRRCGRCKRDGDPKRKFKPATIAKYHEKPVPTLFDVLAAIT